MVRSDERRAYYTRRQGYIETVMRDTSNTGMQSCTKSCYAIEYCIQSVFNVQRLLIYMQYKIMKQLKSQLEFKAYHFGSALTGAGKSLAFKLAVRTYCLWGGLCPEKLVKINKTNYLLGRF